MATFNSMLFLTLLVAISALMAAPSAVKAQRFDNYIINITGTVRCAVSATFFANGSSASRPFTNANVQLQCRRRNTTIASTTTDANGTFSIIRDPPLGRLTALITYSITARTCRAFVTTPLSACNSTLPTSGNLVSSLTQSSINTVGNTQVYTLRADNFVYST
ncbi:hypothetical protein DCAR_0935446 [Daucus carota subsp. sativus]|uniref:Pollen Ole e 1 allergen and extensin family protein n=1 Tax=Daucus carota subsp. sativus TaxID=79200 RepID=A0A175YIC2_DAUCS|nr:PREDICTED: phylloplanin-like [Daucus carota subsp. sativus]WOH15899.1 hypothetical protein DCAR_0935446 [Daucus carota subsp. sativus]